MERVHNSYYRQWISQPINVEDFRRTWATAAKEEHIFESVELETDEKSLMTALDISKSELLDLEEECSEHALDCPNEDFIECNRKFEIPENVELTTLRFQKKEVDKRNQDQRYRNLVYTSLKYYNYPESEAKRKQASSSQNTDNPIIQLPEILLTVQVFRPEKALSKFQKQAPSRIPVFTIDQDLIVLGCQYLTELRDKIDCVADLAIPGDLSEHPLSHPTTKCKDLYKSCFFYINGTFYNDTRDPNNRDYSLSIINWSNKPDRGIGPFKAANMENTKFIELELQLGYPYVFLHQGYCEHLIVFSDLRMAAKNNCLTRSSYPLYQSLIPKKRSFCMICHIHTARWVVLNNSRLPEDPYFFCEHCFYSYNYTEEDEKIGEFKAFRYIDRTLFL